MHADWQSLGVALAGLYGARRELERSVTVVLVPGVGSCSSLPRAAIAVPEANDLWQPSVPRRMALRDLGRVRSPLR